MKVWEGGGGGGVGGGGTRDTGLVTVDMYMYICMHVCMYIYIII